jgi:hypothetical protein
VPNLFAGEDLAALQEMLTKPAQAAGVNSGSPAELQVRPRKYNTALTSLDLSD